MQLPFCRIRGKIDYMRKRIASSDTEIVLIELIKSDDVCLKCIGGMVSLLPISEKAKRWWLIAALLVQWIVELLCKVRWYVWALLGLVLC